MAHPTRTRPSVPSTAGASLLALALAASRAHADPVPIVLVGTAGDPAEAGRDAVDRASNALGADALVGAALAARVTEGYASPPLPGDPLAGARDRARAAQRAWSDASSTGDSTAEQRALAELRDAATEMERVPQALDEHEPDRAAYQRALLFLAERFGAAQMSTQADEALVRLARFDPSAVLAPASCSATTRAAFARAVQSLPRGALTVESVPPGCAVLRDGRAVGAAPVELQDLSPGDHRITVSCGAVRSLVHHAQVAPNARATVVIDPQLDAAIALEPVPALRYASLPQGRARLAQDLAVIGRALGARRIVGVIAANDRVVVVDVASGAEVGNADLGATAQLRTLVTQAVTTPNAPSPRANAPSGASHPVTVTHTRGGGVPVGAIVIGVIGVAALAAGAYALPYSFDATHRENQSTSATARVDDAQQADVSQWIAIGTLAGGGALFVTGVLVALLGRSTETVQLRAALAPLHGGAWAGVGAAF